MKGKKLSDGERVAITMSKADKEQIEQAAHDAGLTMSAFLRILIKNHLKKEKK